MLASASHIQILPPKNKSVNRNCSRFANPDEANLEPPFSLRTWLESTRNFGNTRFRRFAMFCRSLDPDRSRTGDRTGPDQTGREHLGLDRFQKTDPYHQIIIRSYHHIIISYHHHIIIASHHCIITISHHQDTVVIQTHDQKIPKFQNFTRHFLANSADRPEICATIGGIMQ